MEGACVGRWVSGRCMCGSVGKWKVHVWVGG